MERNKANFLAFLAGEGTRNVIFEPFLSHRHAETLIWRRGGHLWDTADGEIDTLTALTERTQGDMVFADLRNRTDEEKYALLGAIDDRAARETTGYGVLCEAKDIPLAESCSGVSCLGMYGAGSSRLPIIRMDGTMEEAIRNGDAGWFAASDAEHWLEASDGRIRILGGLGVDRICCGSPVGIYARVEKIAAAHPGMWACGSGGTVPEDNYLELISLLGAFARIR